MTGVAPLEAISLSSLTAETKVRLLRELGYDSDGTWVLTKEGLGVPDRYTGEPVKLSNMLIFPGSTIILDNNPLSIACYFDEFGEFQ